MKQPNLPPIQRKLQGPDGKTLTVGPSTSMDKDPKQPKTSTTPAPLSEHIGGRAIPFKKTPGE